MIIPYTVAAEYAENTGKGPTRFEDMHEAHLHQLRKSNTEVRGQQQVAILLGHYNHGKTTLLDSLSSTTLVSTEVDDITQEIRTIVSRIPMIHVENLGDMKSSFPAMVHGTYNKIINTADDTKNGLRDDMKEVITAQTLSTSTENDLQQSHYLSMTLIDTPGQDVFFRMRNYAASVADFVILLVAADEEICLQTKESIGILQSLNLPCIVCINKIDKLKSDGFVDHLLSLEKKLRDYEGLDTAPIIPISAKFKVNLHFLAVSIQQVLKRKPSKDTIANVKNNTRNSKGKTYQSVSSMKGVDSTVKQCTSYGVVLNVWKSRKDGLILHTVVRTGQVRVGDNFAAGGWSGTVRALFTMTPEVSDLYESNTLTMDQMESDSNHTVHRDSRNHANEMKMECAGANTSVVATIPRETVKSVDAGMGVFISVKPDVANDPRPLGEPVLFARGDKAGKGMCEALVSQKEMELRFPMHLVTNEEKIQELTKLAARLQKIKIEEEIVVENYDGTDDGASNLRDKSLYADEVHEILRQRVVVKCHSDLEIGNTHIHI